MMKGFEVVAQRQNKSVKSDNGVLIFRQAQIQL
jgi:hypothetical protein